MPPAGPLHLPQSPASPGGRYEEPLPQVPALSPALPCIRLSEVSQSSKCAHGRGADQTCLGLPAKPLAPAGSQPNPGDVSPLCQADLEHPRQTPEVVPSHLRPGSTSKTTQPCANSKVITGSQSLEGSLSSEHCLPYNKLCLPTRPCASCPHLRGTLGSGPQQSPLPAVRRGHTTLSLASVSPCKNRHNDFGNSP